MEEPARIVATAPEGETITGMLEFKGEIFIATTGGAYVLEGGEMNKIKLKGDK